MINGRTCRRQTGRAAAALEKDALLKFRVCGRSVDTTGAGDSFAGLHAWLRAADTECLQWGSACGALDTWPRRHSSPADAAKPAVLAT
jgi:sugar/nucleoside kinase (ribokinase family)